MSDLIDDQTMDLAAEHIRQLCRKHGIAINVLGPERGLQVRSRPGIGRIPPRVWIEHVATPRRYFFALHEIGHVVDPAARLKFPWQKRLGAEFAAWRWAVQESRVRLTPSVGRCIREALMGYVRAAASGWSHDIPEPDDALWAFIEQMDPDYRSDHDGLGPGDIWGNDPQRGAARRTNRRTLAGAALFVGGLLTAAAEAGYVPHAWLHGTLRWPAMVVAWGGVLVSLAGLGLFVVTSLTALLEDVHGSASRGRVDGGRSSAWFRRGDRRAPPARAGGPPAPASGGAL